MHAYNDPAAYGLTFVGEHDAGEMYQWDIFAVWKDNETGRYYWGHDSGCSCNWAFEDMDGLDGLESGNRHDAIAALEDWGGRWTDVSGLIEKIVMSR